MSPRKLSGIIEIINAAERGDPEGQFAMGCYATDKPVEAAKWFRLAAEQGHAHAQCNLGLCYENGEGVKKNEKEAVKWYRKAAEQGCDKSQCFLGICYQNGQGIAKDDVEAAKWFSLSANQGNSDAQFLLGVCYDYGEGVPQDEAEAVKWYRLSADQGNAEAQGNLGTCYKQGTGIAQNEKEAVKWYRKAAEQEDANAQYNLGYCYKTGSGVPQDSAKALEWFHLAAEQNHAESQYTIGVCYQLGEGVAVNEAETVNWYRKAAGQDLALAQTGLGSCYYSGFGVAEDVDEAVKWFRLAAEQGDATAQYYLGVCYADGTGVEPDAEEAVKWFQLAAEQGDEDAKKALAAGISDESDPSDDDEEFDAEHIRLAAEAGDADAQVQLGLAYRSGNGIAQDPEQALVWLRKAAEQGDPRYVALLGVWRLAGDGSPQDLAEAEFWLGHAASQHDPMAWCFLEELCPGHLGAGSDPIFNVLGLMHKPETGFPETINKIIDWLMLAASGSADPKLQAWAQFNLGVAYEIGTVARTDLVEAYAWQKLGQAGIKKEFGMTLKLSLAKEMSDEQKTAGEKRWRDLLEKIVFVKTSVVQLFGCHPAVWEILQGHVSGETSPQVEVAPIIEQVRQDTPDGGISPLGPLRYQPECKSATVKMRFQVGPYIAVLFGDIEPEGHIEYRYFLGVFDEAMTPYLFVAAESCPMFGTPAEAGEYVLGVFDGDQHLNFGSSTDWADQDKFLDKAMRMVYERLGIPMA